jgi:hypothetical protein
MKTSTMKTTKKTARKATTTKAATAVSWSERDCFDELSRVRAALLN